jgi:hypothetical protein
MVYVLHGVKKKYLICGFTLLEVIEPVLIIRPDDSPIDPKYVK